MWIRIFVALSFALSWGSQLNGQSLAEWGRRDTAAFNKIYDNTETIDELFEALRSYLAQRQASGPITKSLANYYHWIPLRLKYYYPNEVLAYADTAIDLRVRVGADIAKVAQSHYERGRVLQQLGRYTESLESHEEGVRLLSKAIAERDTTENLANRQGYFLKEAAVAARFTGDYVLANLYLDQIPQLLKFAPNPITEFDALVTRGDIYDEQGLLSKANAAYTAARALPYFEDAYIGDKGVVLLNQAILLNDMGKAKAAQELLNEALQLTATEGEYELNRLSMQAESLRSLSLIGGSEQAINKLVAAGLATAETLYPNDQGPVLGELLLRAAEAYDKGGNSKMRDSLFIQAGKALGLRISESPGTNGPRLTVAETDYYDRKTSLKLLAAQRDGYLKLAKRGNTEAAKEGLVISRTIDTLLQDGRRAITMSTSLGQTIDLESGNYTTALRLAMSLYRNTREAQYLEEAYLIVARQKSNLLRRYLRAPGLATALGVDTILVQRMTEMEVDLLTTERNLPLARLTEQDSLRGRITELNRDIRSLRKSVYADNPRYARALADIPDIDPLAAAASLAVDQQVIEYHLTKDSVYLFSLGKSEGLRVNVRQRPDSLASLIAGMVEDPGAAEKLYDLLVRPVIQTDNAIRRIRFIPHDLLTAVPFGALRDGQRFLIERFAISQSYSASLLFDEKIEEIDYDYRYQGYGISYKQLLNDLIISDNRTVGELRDMGPLTWADKEVMAAAEIMDGDAWIDNEATKDRFVSASTNAAVLHFSMHGLLRKNPLESSLAFLSETGGLSLLTMAEVLRSWIPAELTVLSACHTGGGPLQTSEGITSMARAFRAAGSQAVLSSLWEANDRTTHEILTSFYDNLRLGENKDVALQRAIIAYLEEATLADRLPRNWANLTVVGNIDPLKSTAGFPMKWLLVGVGVLMMAYIIYRKMR